MIAGPLYIVWFILIGIRLFQFWEKASRNVIALM